MIEIHNIAGTKSYGCFHNMKSAKPTLDYLRETGQLQDENHEVLACQFKSDQLQQVYKISFNGKWRTVKYTKPVMDKTRSAQRKNFGGEVGRPHTRQKPPCRMTPDEIKATEPKNRRAKSVNAKCRRCKLEFQCGFRQPVIYGSTTQPW